MNTNVYIMGAIFNKPVVWHENFKREWLGDNQWILRVKKKQWMGRNAFLDSVLLLIKKENPSSEFEVKVIYEVKDPAGYLKGRFTWNYIKDCPCCAEKIKNNSMVGNMQDKYAANVVSLVKVSLKHDIVRITIPEENDL